MKTPFLFSLSLLFALSFSLAQEKVIAIGDEWQYYDAPTPPPVDWYKSNKSTNDWRTGPSPLGYGDDMIATTVSFGDDPGNKHVTKYFKKTFRIEDPYKHLFYRLNIQRDDGIVIYLNGYEIMRDNMPDGVITDTTTASSLIFTGDLEKITHSKLLSPDDFHPGTNTFSVSVHQGRRISSDCIFNLELFGDDGEEMIPMLLKERTLENMSLEMKIKELSHIRELEKRDQQKTLLSITLYVLGFLLLALFTGLIYFFKFHRNKTKFMTEKLHNLEQAATAKDRKLMNFSLKSVQQQQFLRALKDNLSEDSLDDLGSLKKEVKKVVRKIDYNIDHDEDWMELISHFNSINTGFIDRLMTLHPLLSETEQRHCIFIKLHMQTKEIAQLMHIAPRSVQATRYRIKKKMDLDDSVNLISYIQDL